MFKWIICARRPLHIEELREAVPLDMGDSHLEIDQQPSGDNWRLIQICGNLAVLNRGGGTVRLAHHPVQQFLLTQSDMLQVSYADSTMTEDTLLNEIEGEIGELC